MRYFSRFMKTFTNKYTNIFTEMIYKYNYTKPLKDNDILKVNILDKSNKKIPFNEQWETKDFYRKNTK